jgi:ribosomal-protein-alanine N-acetyltransferase
MIVNLHTPRLHLRKPSEADIDTIQQLANDPLIADNTLKLPYPYSIQDAEEFVRYVQRAWHYENDYIFAVVEQDSGQYIGSAGIFTKDFDIAEIGYWIGKPYRNRGFATETVRRVIQFGFDDLNQNRIQAFYFTHNPASRRVQEKAGMIFEGVLRQHFKKGDEYIDAGICSILREEYITLYPEAKRNDFIDMA